MLESKAWTIAARRTHARIARFYDLVDLPFEYRRYRFLRPLLFDGLSGRILDADVGTGRNMPFYPRGSEVLGIDLSPAMLRRAERRRAHSPATVRLAEMDVTSLDLPDASFDVVSPPFSPARCQKRDSLRRSPSFPVS